MRVSANYLYDVRQVRICDLSISRLQRAGQPIDGGQPNVIPERTDIDGNASSPRANIEDTVAIPGSRLTCPGKALHVLDKLSGEHGHFANFPRCLERFPSCGRWHC